MKYATEQFRNVGQRLPLPEIRELDARSAGVATGSRLDGFLQGPEAGQQILGRVGLGPASEHGGQRPGEGGGDGGVDAVNVHELISQALRRGSGLWHADEQVSVPRW